ncbi:MAG: Do family serine endopeptidase [Cucumibacter sp.]
MTRTLVALLLLAAGVPAPAQEAREAPQSGTQIQLSFAPVVRRAAPSVVNVYATRVEAAGRSLFDDPVFQRFFGENSPFSRSEPRQRSSLGSGVIVDASGVILTNNHVIEDASDIRVATADGREYETDIVLADPETDLAVLRIRDTGGRTFPSIEFADSEALLVGDLVLAIGNPFGIGQTVTSGIVSALARSGVGVSDFQFFIQTDAAINPGNSGGALVDMAGRLVGINTEIITRSGGSMGVGFAIPANMAKFVANAAITTGAIVRPWVGVTLQAVSSDIADSLGMEAPHGALVAAVAPDSPASRAGIAAGDVIVAFDGQAVGSEGAFGYRLSTKTVGETAHLVLLRGGGEVGVDLLLEPQPATLPGDTVTIEGDTRFAGVTAATITAFLIDEFELAPDATGVVVTGVVDGSPAARMGLRPGDVIVGLNGADMTDANSFEALATSGAGRWNIVLQRGRSILQSSVPG